MLKRILTISAFMLVGSIIAIGIQVNAGKAVVEPVQESDIMLGDQWQDVRVRCNGATGTTTPTYLTSGSASTTCQMYVADITDVDLNWSLTGSSTSSVLQYNLKFSNDDGANKNWYYAKAFATTGTQEVTYSSDPLLTKIELSSTDNTLINTVAEDIYAKWMIVEYATAGANSSAYLELVSRNNE